MANQNRPLNQHLRELKVYATKIRKAAKWKESNETIAHVSIGASEKKTREYIYEFYCYVRILADLKTHYDLTFIPGTRYGNHFPKAPGKKGDYPYFSIVDKTTGEEVFQLCAGIDIIGRQGETSAPDISILQPGTGNRPTHEETEFLFDAKFRHDPSKKVSKGEFNDVFAMIFNLNCIVVPPGLNILFNEFSANLDLNGNHILTNGKAYNENVAHHQMHFLSEMELFDIGALPRRIG